MFKIMLESSIIEEPFVATLRTYLTGTLHVAVKLETWKSEASLPLFITKRYRFYRMSVARQDCLVMLAGDESMLGPADIVKHVSRLSESFPGVVVYAARTMNATLRSRLIAQGVAFIVPGNQLYMPQLAMDLREHFRAPQKKRGEHLTPAAQLVLFHHILSREDAPVTPTQLAEPLGFAPMSIGRAFDKLAQTGLAKVERRGREKVLCFKADRQTLLDLGRSLLRTPARGLHGVRFKRNKPDMLRAGEAALADLTNLSPPEKPSYAILATGWQGFFRQHDIEDVNEIDAAEAFIETWHYDPSIFGKDGCVDPLSLYAQFWDHPDERVAQAAVDVLERVRW